MKTILIPSALTLLLIGCGQTDYNTKLEVYCPAHKQYDEDFNNQLANEIESLPSTATALPEALSDYSNLLDKVRRCAIGRDKIR